LWTKRQALPVDIAPALGQHRTNEPRDKKPILLPMNWGNIEHRTSNAEHRMKESPHLTLTLSPPIRMGAEREQQAVN
jgi:hypothetical protein